jgi:ORF6N domain-containing protein
MESKRSGQSALVPPDRITQALLVRGQKVILDEDLANLYEVETKAVNRAVRRNLDRFPEDFMFQLAAEEFTNLRFQSGASNLRSQFGTSRWGGRRYRPYAFTEQGVAMLSSVLHSARAIRVNIEIMRAFVQGADPEDPDEYRAASIFWVPKEARWQHLPRIPPSARSLRTR